VSAKHQSGKKVEGAAITWECFTASVVFAILAIPINVCREKGL
jgi:hypothetical protein